MSCHQTPKPEHLEEIEKDRRRLVDEEPFPPLAEPRPADVPVVEQQERNPDASQPPPHGNAPTGSSSA